MSDNPFARFTTPGGRIDWDSYHRSEVEVGSRCSHCGQFIVMHKGCRTLCASCRGLAKSEELRHEKLIRCPKCGNDWDPAAQEDFNVFEEGTHEVSCGGCSHEFEITTMVEYTFTSPGREVEK